MNWNRVKCCLLGHAYATSDVAARAACMRCGELRPAIEWDRSGAASYFLLPVIGGNVNPPPAYPRPTAPPTPPARKDVIRLKVEVDGLDEAKAEVAQLHAQYSEVIAMRERIARGEW
jgi:hypothetical protein